MTTRSSNSEFRCIHCGYYVSALRLVCGVNNRNHCPYCLWSRHLDLFVAGDRLSACKAPMRPIGLTMKPSRNKYAPSGGELMLVHICEDCEQVSINRIAADDDAESLVEIFSNSFAISSQTFELLSREGIHLPNRGDIELIQEQLMAEVLTI